MAARRTPSTGQPPPDSERLNGVGEAITWEEPEMVVMHGRRRPDYADDRRFTRTWWANGGLGPPDHQWRSYIQRGEEVARLLLHLRYPAHSSRTNSPAVMVWSFEVREDLRCNGTHLGTAIIQQLASEYRDREIYVGPTQQSASFWARFGWPMCNCTECDGRDLIVRRPKR